MLQPFLAVSKAFYALYGSYTLNLVIEYWILCKDQFPYSLVEPHKKAQRTTI